MDATNKSAPKSIVDPTYADFGRGRFDVISGSKLAYITTYAGQSILDVGCGPGAYIRALRERGYHVDGVDGNKVMLTEALKTGAKIYHLDLDKEGLSLIPNNQYDTTICLDVLEHLQQPTEVLAELVRVARRNVLVSVPAETPALLSQAGLVYASSVDSTHLRYYTPAGLRNDLIQVGLKSVEVYPTMSIRPVLVHLFSPRWRWFFHLLNRVLAYAILPEANWIVLLGIGYK